MGHNYFELEFDEYKKKNNNVAACRYKFTLYMPLRFGLKINNS